MSDAVRRPQKKTARELYTLDVEVKKEGVLQSDEDFGNIVLHERRPYPSDGRTLLRIVNEGIGRGCR